MRAGETEDLFLTFHRLAIVEEQLWINIPICIKFLMDLQSLFVLGWY